MERRTVRVCIAGQQYKVVSSAAEGELQRLASKVDAKVAELTPRGRAATPQSMLLAAIALAHEAQEERARRESVEQRTRDVLRKVLVRIDEALDAEPVDAVADEPAGADHGE